MVVKNFRIEFQVTVNGLDESSKRNHDKRYHERSSKLDALTVSAFAGFDEAEVTTEEILGVTRSMVDMVTKKISDAKEESEVEEPPLEEDKGEESKAWGEL